MWPRFGLIALALTYATVAFGLLRDGTVHGPMNPNNLMLAAIHGSAAIVSIVALLVLHARRRARIAHRR